MRSLISQITLHKLEVFCHVAELGSVSRAAEKCSIAQPVVTTHVKSLAQKIGVPLTKKNGRQITLTEDGERIYAWAKEIISQTRELEDELRDRKAGTTGSASIAASMTLGSYILPSIVSRFKDGHVHSDISVQIANPKMASELVQRGECDFGFTIFDRVRGISSLEVIPLYSEKLILAAARDSAIVGSEITPESLSDLPFITARANTARRDLEDYALMTHGIVRSNIVLEFGHGEAIKQSVRAGSGIAFLFESSVKDELLSGVLREVRTPGMALAFPIYFVRRKDKKMTAFQHKLANFICAEIGSLNQLS
ncbi:LysR family transcriptional regulator [Phaeobacter gallaeciensis]|uniref:Transcriptional regulator, LysR family n=1 Tax=Phaeobacter gallaeciensis TaxID=60890 RepID=A0AAC9ZCQ7_9RHOB|nr:LysR family transcriptional regulator [Phaeobacter gallaeciensis]AHD11859.1 transcriptional regulator, LysR family [Phaeobacter gallaeciensis DSM 26640]ATE95122.1 transcriptional regulator, LysR family [Phaeobacter gallaeciensis]ATE99430.1 transcriptional regulator, LysR family [Phaeobacter gallaeciensis]ATF03827.1 transcriptional regulator, LysR family [Phaeobacter gallaeciensis]ATF08020.1 transcriptional regulator, LysR family [Phaeobacter gallaeciensis]